MVTYLFYIKYAYYFKVVCINIYFLLNLELKLCKTVPFSLICVAVFTDVNRLGTNSLLSCLRCE